MEYTNITVNELLSLKLQLLRSELLSYEVREEAKPLHSDENWNLAGGEIPRSCKEFKLFFLLREASISFEQMRNTLKEILKPYYNESITVEDFLSFLNDFYEGEDWVPLSDWFHYFLATTGANQVEIDSRRELRRLRIQSFALVQSGAQLRPHKTEIKLLDHDGKIELHVDLEVRELERSECEQLVGKKLPKAVVLNSTGVGFFSSKIDEKSLEFILRNYENIEDFELRYSVLSYLLEEKLYGDFISSAPILLKHEQSSCLSSWIVKKVVQLLEGLLNHKLKTGMMKDGSVEGIRTALAEQLLQNLEKEEKEILERKNKNINFQRKNSKTPPPNHTQLALHKKFSSMREGLERTEILETEEELRKSGGSFVNMGKYGEKSPLAEKSKFSELQEKNPFGNIKRENEFSNKKFQEPTFGQPNTKKNFDENFFTEKNEKIENLLESIELVLSEQTALKLIDNKNSQILNQLKSETKLRVIKIAARRFLDVVKRNSNFKENWLEEFLESNPLIKKDTEFINSFKGGFSEEDVLFKQNRSESSVPIITTSAENSLIFQKLVKIYELRAGVDKIDLIFPLNSADAAGLINLVRGLIEKAEGDLESGYAMKLKILGERMMEMNADSKELN